ncbi:MAG TPA: hypothetical protein ENI23_16015 [bacterium]|nr:hypothetical protein [bacterium]
MIVARGYGSPGSPIVSYGYGHGLFIEPIVEVIHVIFNPIEVVYLTISNIEVFPFGVQKFIDLIKRTFTIKETATKDATDVDVVDGDTPLDK